MGAFDSILYAGIGGAVIGAIMWVMGRVIRFLFPPQVREEKDPIAEQLKASEEWKNRNVSK